MSSRPGEAADSSKAASGSLGLVVAAHGRRGLLAAADGGRLPYRVRGRHLRVCCGDRVHFVGGAEHEPALVTGIAARDNELQRLSARGLPETIAANVTHLIVVMAALPAPDLFLTDRYLCAAGLMGTSTALAWNKSDRAALPAGALSAYETLGCHVLPVSALAGTGLGALQAWIGQGTGILVGQSGVGKSSLLNALVPGADVATAEISAASDEGRHTTSASVLHPLPGGGGLLDTPGVRDFVPAIPGGRAISGGFVEIEAHGRRCKFNDCSHLREDHCAVQAAVADGRIDPRRYESYRRLMNLVRQNEARPY